MLNIYNEAKEKGAIQAIFQEKIIVKIFYKWDDYADDGLLFNLPDIKLYV